MRSYHEDWNPALLQRHACPVCIYTSTRRTAIGCDSSPERHRSWLSRLQTAIKRAALLPMEKLIWPRMICLPLGPTGKGEDGSHDTSTHSEK